MQKAAARTADLQHPNGTNLLTGGSDSVLCRSMVSALNVDRKVNAADTSHVAEDNKWLQVRVPLNMSNEEAGTISMLPKFHMVSRTTTNLAKCLNGISLTVVLFYPPPVYWLPMSFTGKHGTASPRCHNSHHHHHLVGPV
ncbi:BnaC05g24380D [Brassica napus]|uniref:(rape) hypothetical protein n=1 Tax=Brassica napus TaxID=3708 RepID=A0A078G810_BRANA|nr:unnamed protein product [Brassica napus]CDY22600.1 BnaC05g24380D [Brassica napus]